MNSGIYKITNRINGKCYIGLSANVYKRMEQHKNNFSKDFGAKKLYWAIEEWGIENFDFEVLEICDYEILGQREIYWINEFNSFKEGYNSSSGGEGVIISRQSLEDLAITEKPEDTFFHSYRYVIRKENGMYFCAENSTLYTKVISKATRMYHISQVNETVEMIRSRYPRVRLEVEVVHSFNDFNLILVGVGVILLLFICIALIGAITNFI